MLFCSCDFVTRMLWPFAAYSFEANDNEGYDYDKMASTATKAMAMGVVLDVLLSAAALDSADLSLS